MTDNDLTSLPAPTFAGGTTAITLTPVVGEPPPRVARVAQQMQFSADLRVAEFLVLHGRVAWGREADVPVRATLASDPFAQRVMGDGVRLNALSSDRLSGDPAAMLPAVVALLPRTFTLAELREAIAATLGVHPRDFDFGSGFRRRIQEFVLSRVLREVGSTRDLPDFGSDGPAVGRPARRYEFDADAWRMWLRDRGERGAGPGSRTAFAPREDVIAGNVATPAPARMPAPPRDDSPALRPLHARSRKAPPEQPTEDEGRIARLERMVERLAEQLRSGDQQKGKGD